MEILWKSDRPLTTADIRQLGTVNPNTIAVCLRTLLKKNAIKVADIVYSNTVLARSYVPVLDRDTYWADCYRQSAGDGNTMQLVRQFVSDSEDIHVIEQLEKLIEAKKKNCCKNNMFVQQFAKGSSGLPVLENYTEKFLREILKK